MITEQLKKIIETYKITDTDSIIYGTNIPMPKAVIPTPWKTYIKFDKAEFYFFHFNYKGITIYPIDGETYAVIPWDEVVDFKVRHVSILGKMTIKTREGTYKFQLNRFVVGCPWIGENTRFLEGHHYFWKS